MNFVKNISNASLVLYNSSLAFILNNFRYWIVLFENFFALSALFGAFVRQVAVYLLRTVESSELLYAAGGNETIASIMHYFFQADSLLITSANCLFAFVMSILLSFIASLNKLLISPTEYLTIYFPSSGSFFTMFLYNKAQSDSWKKEPA